MTSPMYEDLQRHLSQEIQKTIGRHAHMAATILPNDEVMMLMLGSAVDAACCAVGSTVGSLALAGGLSEADTADAVSRLIETQNAALSACMPQILERISSTIGAERAKVA